MTVLGIDENRRGKSRYEIHIDTGTKMRIDWFESGLVDVGDSVGLLAQISSPHHDRHRVNRAKDRCLADRDLPRRYRYVGDLHQNRQGSFAPRDRHSARVLLGRHGYTYLLPVSLMGGGMDMLRWA